MEKNKILTDINRFEQKRILQVALQLGAGILSATILFFPILALLEYFLYLSPGLKLGFLLGYSGLMIVALWYWVARPWWNLQNTRSIDQYQTLSQTVSGRVKNLDDKLLNYLQLLSLSLKGGSSSLVSYSLSQKQDVISRFNIPGQISVNIPRSVLTKFIPLAATGLILVLVFFDFIKEGSNRLVHVNQEYHPPAPFGIEVAQIPTRILATQILEVKSSVSGPALPEQLFVKVGSRTLKMTKGKSGQFSQIIENLDVGKHSVFVFSGNISSPENKVEVLAPGQIQQLSIKVTPPAYTKRTTETLENEGNLQIAKGSLIEWNLETENLSDLKIGFGTDPLAPFQVQAGGKFNYSKKILSTSDYQINSKNALNQPDQKLNYQIEVIEDQFPRIQASAVMDSISFSKQYFVGRIADDYGFSRLAVVIQDPKTKKVLAEAPVSVSRSEKNQEFAYIPEGKVAATISQQAVVLSFKVWDNDGVAGPKATSSQIFDVKDASKNVIAESVDRLDKKNEENLEELVKKTESLEKNSRKMMEDLKGKKELNWQDKKELQNYVEKQKDLFKQIEDLKKEAEKSLQNKQENKLQSQEMLDKQEQINKMLEEILDPKTKELLKELERLMQQQNQNKDQLQDAFEKMQDKNEFIQNELDRAMEMLKQLKVEEKLDKAINDLDKLAEEQNKEGEKNEKEGDKQSDAEKKDAQEKQNEMKDKFKQIQDDVKQMQEINKSLEEKNKIETGQEEEKGVEEDQKQSAEEMKEGKMKKAGKPQKSAAQKMKKMAKKMKESQMEMEGGGADKEDIGDLRYIIENLLHLSFNQEEVYKEVSKVNQLDPKYLALTQKQIKIKDDSEIIKDSLKALAKRAPEIQSFVMKELFAMGSAIDEAVDFVKARRPDIASAKGQMAMTNINNLTVMLKDALQQMQQQQQQQQKGGSKACKKPGKGKPKPGGMSQMQKQLNDQISKMKNGQKPGSQMSKELAQMAQKQAALRRALGELEKSLQKGKDKSGGLGDVKAQMEKTERELLNKKLTPETIMRQQQILTRLLESEKALMEREKDERREAEKPNSQERITLPAEIRELLRKSQSQKEQLQQGTPKLTEMYQEAFDKYFESIQENGQ